MKFDIIELTEEQVKKLSAVQAKLLRTAQQKKDELYIKAEKEIKICTALAHTARMHGSTVLAHKIAETENERDRQVALLTDNLIYGMSLNEPTGGDVTGGNAGDGYVVDNSLSYSERYVMVKEYYMTIEDANERLALYAADNVAKSYLGEYYSALYNVLYSYTR